MYPKNMLKYLENNIMVESIVDPTEVRMSTFSCTPPVYDNVSFKKPID